MSTSLTICKYAIEINFDHDLDHDHGCTIYQCASKCGHRHWGSAVVLLTQPQCQPYYHDWATTNKWTQMLSQRKANKSAREQARERVEENRKGSKTKKHNATFILISTNQS